MVVVWVDSQIKSTVECAIYEDTRFAESLCPYKQGRSHMTGRRIVYIRIWIFCSNKL